MKTATFQDLKVWQKMHRLTLDIYGVTRNYPPDERFGLVSQLRRSSASVATNIVEGFKRGSKKDKAHFFNMAEGSLEETKYHLILSKDLNYLSLIDYQNLYKQSEEVGRMLNAYRQSLLRSISSLLFSAFFLFLILTSYSLIQVR
jgi:four helix bundle protein